MKKNNVFLVIVFIIVFLFIGINILAKPLSDGDEIINLFNTYKLYEGLKIYKQIPVVAMPLLFYLGVIIFKILGVANLLNFRIYNIIVNIVVVISLYRIFRKLDIRKLKSIIYTILLELILVSKPITMGITYNMLAYAICLVGINIALKRDKIKRYFLIQGITIFLVFMAKQNIGVYYALANILIEVILYKKECIKNIFKLLITPILLGIVYILYLYFNNSLFEFIDYTVLGAIEFSSNLYFSGGMVWLGADLIMIASSIILLYNKIINNKYMKNTIILFIYGVCLLLMGYPIFDYWHMALASIVLIISIIYIIEKTLKINIKEKYLKMSLVLLIIYMLFSIGYKSYVYLNIYCKEKENIFYGIIVTNDMQKKIEDVISYINKSDKKVVIASCRSGKYYMYMDKKGNDIFDTPLRGNIGSNQLEKIINKTNSLKDVYLLLMTENESWQDIKEFRKYIKDNYEKIGEVSEYSIYYIP